MEKESLTYFLAEKNNILVVHLIGPLIHKNMHVLESCGKEIGSRKAKAVIVNFRDVAAGMDRSMVPVLAKIQKQIRVMPAALRMSSLHPDLNHFLEVQGLIRSEELANNLNEALRTIVLKVAA